MAFGLSMRGKIPEARALLSRLREETPLSPDVYMISSYVEMTDGKLDLALALIQQAITVGEETGHFQSRITSYKQLEAYIGETLAAGEEQ